MSNGYSVWYGGSKGGIYIIFERWLGRKERRRKEEEGKEGRDGKIEFIVLRKKLLEVFRLLIW